MTDYMLAFLHVHMPLHPCRAPLQVTESYRVGATSRNRRRDLRSGDAVSSTRYVEQGLHIETSFGDSFPGNVEETYWSPEPGVLCVRSTIYVGDRRKGAQRSASTLQVWLRLGRQKLIFSVKGAGWGVLCCGVWHENMYGVDCSHAKYLLSHACAFFHTSSFRH